VDAGVQFEVVLSLEGLLAGGTLEAAADAVRGEVAAEVALAREHLVTGEEEEEAHTHARTHTHTHKKRHIYDI